MKKKNALVIFIKTPLPHQVKTRLQPHLSAEESTLIYRAFIRDLDQRYQKQKAFDCWYAVAPENFNPDILKKLVDLARHLMQQGADLGERMSHAFGTVFSAGYRKIVLIGSDLPTLRIDTINQAFNLLDKEDCVIGPGFDGGYYLIALKKDYPSLFRDIAWSTETVYKNTLALMDQNHLSFSVLPVQRDIDSIDDVLALYDELKNSNKDSKDYPLDTWRVIDSIMKSKNLC